MPSEPRESSRSRAPPPYSIPGRLDTVPLRATPRASTSYAYSTSGEPSCSNQSQPRAPAVSRGGQGQDNRSMEQSLDRYYGAPSPYPQTYSSPYQYQPVSNAHSFPQYPIAAQPGTSYNAPVHLATNSSVQEPWQASRQNHAGLTGYQSHNAYFPPSMQNHAQHSHSYHGTVHQNNIASSGPTFSGDNYGIVIQNTTEDPHWKEALATRLKICRKADYQYYPGGNESGMKRNACTAGTRVGVIEDVMSWGSNPSPHSESVFWLSGQAGAGKTTIAYTVADRFARQPASSAVTLGGSFFCSRHSMETMSVVAIIRTLVYQLALQSPSFRAALMEHGDFEAVNHGPKSQLERLLVIPWQISERQRQVNREPCLANTIDALDELEADGGVEFLETLFDVLNEHRLVGIKFFVTSRLEPSIVGRIGSFDKKQVFRLEEMPIDQSSADIRKYLEIHLSPIASYQDREKLVADADGLFIYAATVVEYLKGRSPTEQSGLLRHLLSLPLHSSRPLGATEKLDMLYTHILETSLVHPRDRRDEHTFKQCLALLHTFLCTIERTSTSVAADLVKAGSEESDPSLFHLYADGVLSRLHSVLYSLDGVVMWFHKSFQDFIFDERRSSSRFFCNQAFRHQVLSLGCFKIMQKELRFNIANIASSYVFDRDNPMLSASIAANISPTLGYACRSWSGHTSPVYLALSEPLHDILNDFLQRRILFWIEVMSLLQLRGHCEGMLLEVQKSVNAASVVPSTRPSRITDDLADAAAFALYFSTSGAEISTPHLYISALSTFPRRLGLPARWRQHFQGIPSFGNSDVAAGGALLSSILVESAFRVIAISQDGKDVAVGMQNGAVSVRRLATGEILGTIRCHQEFKAVTALAYSPDDKTFASASEDRSVRIWRLPTGEELLRIGRPDLTSTVMSLGYSPDGQRIVAGSKGTQLLVWEAGSGVKVLDLRGHTAAIRSCEYLPSGAHIVSSAEDGTVRVWDASSGEQLEVFQGDSRWANLMSCSLLRTSPRQGDKPLHGTPPPEEVQWEKGLSQWDALARSPDGTHIASASGDWLYVWNIWTGKPVKRFQAHGSMFKSVVYTPDGLRIVSCSSDYMIRVWDACGGEAVKQSDGHSGAIRSVVYSPDGRHIASGSEDRSVRVWDALSGEELTVLEGHTKAVRSVAYCLDGRCIASGSDDGSVRLWDACSGNQLHLLNHQTPDNPQSVRSVASSLDGMRLVTSSHTSSRRTLTHSHYGIEFIRVWDAATGRQLKVLKFNDSGPLNGPILVSGGRYILSPQNDGSRFWDTETLSDSQCIPPQRLPHPKWHTDNRLAVSPNGKEAVSFSRETQQLTVWTLETGEQLRELTNSVHSVSNVTYSRDGRHLVALLLQDSRGSIKVWDSSSWEQVQEFGVLPACLAFSPDGQNIVAGSIDSSIQIWSLFQTTQYIREKSSGDQYTGWLVSPTDPSKHLMLAPLSETLLHPLTIRSMPSSSRPHVDLSKAQLGDEWTKCYTPQS